MRPVDFKMEICPLKHEIRKSLWERYARAVVGRGRLKSYLTLYSPAMMDIKHFHRCGLLEFKNVYQGVVAVTNDHNAYTEAITRGRGRPKLVIPADIDDLLMNSRKLSSANRQRFRRQFPFQVVNLDYTNSIFWKTEKRNVSLHLQALQKLVDLQRSNGANSFALFLTTTAEQGTIASHFLDVLGDRVATNLRLSRDFATRFHSTYDGQTPDQLRATHYDEFVPLGLAKFVTNLLTSNGFELMECETAVIQRPSSRRILHVACRVRKPRDVSLRGMGRQTHLERKIVKYLDKRENGELIQLDEATDRTRLGRRHGAYVQKLSADTFEIQVPSPEDE